MVYKGGFCTSWRAHIFMYTHVSSYNSKTCVHKKNKKSVHTFLRVYTKNFRVHVHKFVCTRKTFVYTHKCAACRNIFCTTTFCFCATTVILNFTNLDSENKIRGQQKTKNKVRNFNFVKIDGTWLIERWKHSQTGINSRLIPVWEFRQKRSKTSKSAQNRRFLRSRNNFSDFSYF